MDFPRGYQFFSTRERGRWIEEVVSLRLQSAGLTVVDRNVELAGAEIDIVARGQDPLGEELLIFLEVRSRSSSAYGLALQSIGPRKQRQIIRAASAYLLGHDLWEKVAVRFDVVAVQIDLDASHLEIEWIKDAFQGDCGLN